MSTEPHPRTAIEIGLAAAIVAIEADIPLILVAGGANEAPALPSGPFDAPSHRTFEIALRRFVAEQASLEIGYAEQLYTFGDRGRHARAGDTAPHVVSVGYLALTRKPEANTALPAGARFEPWYRFFPWEDWRDGRPKLIDTHILPALDAWAKTAAPVPGAALAPAERIRLYFGRQASQWDEERVLERYELLYSAGLVDEAREDGRENARGASPAPLGQAMRFDHRRILATAISRLRAKLKYRPLVFEMLPEEFTLTELQRTVEAISGRHLHKQNFRRLVENAALVEPTGDMSTRTGGRPAAMYRFRREVLKERPAPGLRYGGR
jgi:hypothetical protein